MYPYFNLFGVNISSYAIMAAIGIVISIAVLILNCKRFHADFDDSIYIYAFSLIGIFLGARILFVIIEIPSRGLSFETIFGGGFVFWGGFIGGWLAAVIAANYFRVNIKDMYTVLVPSMIIFAGFGRIGCFLVGCCYGRESELFGMCYSISEIAPNGCPLFPVQLLEALFDFTVAFLLTGKKDSMFKYTLSYSIFRFFAEFLRGDEVRGFVGRLSVSQFISIVVFGVVLASCLRNVRRMPV